MEEKNNINTLFSRLEDIDIFRKDFSDAFKSTYNDFFSFDRGLVEEPPRKCGIDDERILTEDGRFSLDYSGAHFEGLYISANEQNRLFVTFDVARTCKGAFREQLPFFPRWSWYPYIDGHMLCFEDPMYYLPPPISSKLRIGWFYGNENEDYAVYAADIISKFAGELKIENKNIVLYGSSAGGTTAIRVGAHLPGSRVAAINPQLDIRNHFFSQEFTDMTKIDLYKEDRFLRNNLPALMKSAPDSEFLLIINAESRPDIDMHLINFLKSGDCDRTPVYGLSKTGNTAIWTYASPGDKPHNVQDDYRIYAFIRYLLDDISDEDFVQKHRKEVLYINDWWRSQAQTKQAYQTLKKQQVLLSRERERLYKERLKHVTNNASVLTDSKTARIDIINTSAANRDDTELEWLAVSDRNAKVQAPIWFKKDNGQIYMIHSDSGKITFSFKCVGSGKLNFTLRGIYKKDQNGKAIPYWIDYTGFKINEEIIFSERKSAWHDKPIKYSCDVKNGDIIECTAAWEEHAV